MTTLAIIGAGPGLGRAAARRFGAEGFSVALIARDGDRVARLAHDFQEEAIVARGYSADVRDPASITDALAGAESDLGPIEVLQYSPLPQKEFLRPILESTVEDIRGAFDFSVVGPFAAIDHVLAGMRALGRGTVLFINGGSGARPNPRVAGTSIAFAAEGAYARMLHDILAIENIHVGQLIIPGAITRGHPTHDPGSLADRLWYMHTQRREFRAFVEPMEIP